MQIDRDQQKKKEEKPAKIYMSTDHLKQGDYEIHLLSKTEVIKVISFKK